MDLIDDVVIVTGDPHGNIAAGGGIVVSPNRTDVGWYCGDPRYYGCNWPSDGKRFGYMVLALPTDDMIHTALRHELCHVALGVMNNDALIEECSAKVLGVPQ
jgi:hypothetical protein